MRLAFWRLSPICCFSLYWLGWIFQKPCGAVCRLTLKNLFLPAQKTPTTTTPNCSNEGEKKLKPRLRLLSFEKNNSRCLKNALAFSAANQANNLTNIFHTNAFSNMLLQGSSARVLPASFLHRGSLQLQRCTTQRVVSVGRYQTESRWLSSCVKIYVGALSLEPSDTIYAT